MASFDPSLIETLLNMPESGTLDFKQAQYPFSGASDDAKSELLKDVVAFANGWKTADAHIVVGAADGHGARATVTGIAAADQLDDASVQQFVNSKTNRAVDFAYVPAIADGRPIAVIVIAEKQRRPIYLTTRVGPLASGCMPMRRGSTTVFATLDDAFQMGEAKAAVTVQPQLALRLGNPNTRELYTSPVRLPSRVLVDPPRNELRELLNESRVAIQLSKLVLQLPLDPTSQMVLAHRRKMALLTPVSFAVQNTGRTLLEDVVVRFSIPSTEGLELHDDEPQVRDFGPSLKVRGRPFTTVRARGAMLELVANVGKVQTGLTEWSEPFWIGSSLTRTLTLQLSITADNLAAAVVSEIDLRLRAWQVDDDGSDDVLSAPDPDPEEDDGT